MDVFFKTENGLKFRIELGYWDTVLEIKKKIKKYKRIPVPLQTLFFQGNVLQDHLDIEQCKILHKSRVNVLFDKDQVLQPEQPPAPSKSIGDIINGQDSLVRNNDQSQCKILYKSRLTVLFNKDQVLQPEQPPIPSKPIEDIIYSEDLPLTTKDLEHIQIYLPPEQTKRIINGNHQESQASSSKSVKKNKKIQDSPKNVAMKRIALRVLLPYSGAKNFTVFVNPKDQVRKLRTLVQNRVRDQAAWLRDGYFFKHKERILSEDQSFEWNGVGPSNAINIAPDPWLL